VVLHGSLDLPNINLAGQYVIALAQVLPDGRRAGLNGEPDNLGSYKINLFEAAISIAGNFF